MLRGHAYFTPSGLVGYVVTASQDVTLDEAKAHVRADYVLDHTELAGDCREFHFVPDTPDTCATDLAMAEKDITLRPVMQNQGVLCYVIAAPKPAAVEDVLPFCPTGFHLEFSYCPNSDEPEKDSFLFSPDVLPDTTAAITVHKYAYHIAPTSLREDIMAEGLLPHASHDDRLHRYPSRLYVFQGDAMRTLVCLFATIQAQRLHTKKFDIYRIDAARLPSYVRFYPDVAMHYAHFTTSAISPEVIARIGEIDTDKLKKEYDKKVRETAALVWSALQHRGICRDVN